MKVKRNHEIKIRLSDDELKKVNEAVEKSNLSRESFLRLLLNGYVPRFIPAYDFQNVISQLRRIGNNLNQISVVAHKTGAIDVIRHKNEVSNLKNEIVELKRLMSQPFSFAEIEEMKDGNDKDMAN